jgi:thiol-disulfide isomerase/thioredoxin
MRKVFRLATVGALLLAVGCAGPRAAPDPTPTGPPSPSASASPSRSVASSPITSSSTQPSGEAPSDAPKDVPATLQFTGTKVDGGDFNGVTLVGKPVLLWFWAPWCPVCRGQIDQVQRIAHKYEEKVNVVGVGSLDNTKAISGFAADAPGMTHLSDESGAVWRHFEVVQQSSFVLLDAKGAKVFSVGYGGSDDLADRVAAVAG